MHLRKQSINIYLKDWNLKVNQYLLKEHLIKVGRREGEREHGGGEGQGNVYHMYLELFHWINIYWLKNKYYKSK